MAPLPTTGGNTISLATGWSWALAGQDPEHRALSVRLAEYLVEKEFLGAWTHAAGYLPPREDALKNWGSADQRQIIERISSYARLMPPTDIISSIGPALEQAVVDVLKGQNDPENAAQTAINQLSLP